MKGQNPVADIILKIGVMLLILTLVGYLVDQIVAGERLKIAIEKATVANALATSIDALSTVDEGSVELSFRQAYDIRIQERTVAATEYLSDGTAGETLKAETITLPAEAFLSEARSVCVVKTPEAVEVKRACGKET